MNTIQTKDKTHWLADSKLSCMAAAALAFSALQGVAQQARASAQFVFPANFHAQEIQADGATIHVRVGGQGPAVVLLHGFGDTGDMWALMAAELAHDHRALRSGISLSAVPMLNGWWLAANAFILIVFGTNLRVIRRKSTKQPGSITLRFMHNRVPCIPLLPSSSQFPRMLKITNFQ